MAFRNILIESPARISCRNRQLIIHTDCDHSVAVEDIAALLLESQQSNITAAALSLLGQSGCAVYRADDLMEPFRPLIDLLTVRFIEAEDELTPEKKRMLFNCLNLDILSGGQRHSVAYAMERLVQSLSRSLESGEVKLTPVSLLELSQHRYE